MAKKEKTRDELYQEIAELQAQLQGANEALDAIRYGEVDALVVHTASGDQVFTLQGAEHAYRVMVESISEGAATALGDGLLLYCNRRLAEMLGAPLETLPGTSMARFFSPDDRLIFDRLLEQGRDGPCRAELSFQTGNGSLPVLLSVSPSEVEDSQGVCMIATDLTSQKRSLEVLAAERLSRSILEQAAEAIVVCDTEGTVIRSSQSATALAGKNPLFKRFDQVFPLELDQVQDSGGFSLGAVLEGRLFRGIEARLERQTDLRVGKRRLFHLLLSATPLTSISKGVIGCVISMTDMTERRQMEAERKAITEAAQLNQARIEAQHYLLDQREQERLKIARDLHDGPVQELIGAVFTLKNAIDMEMDGSLKDLLQNAQDVIKKEIVELRNFAGELRPPTISKFGLETALRSHSDVFAERHPDLHVHLLIDLQDTVLTETVSLVLFLIYQEMLNNIARHARASEVTISLTLVDGAAKLQIQDNGIGFTPPRNWVELAREGHLGLVGIQERAEGINGSFEVRSNPGAGTLISVIVPLGNIPQSPETISPLNSGID